MPDLYFDVNMFYNVIENSPIAARIMPDYISLAKSKFRNMHTSFFGV